MVVEVRESGRVAVLAPVGQLDQEAANELESSLAGLPGGRAVIDFSAVDSLDGRGVGVLLAIEQRLRRKGGALGLCRLNEDVMRALRVAKLDRAFAIRDSVDAAIASVSIEDAGLSTLTGLAVSALGLEEEHEKTLSPVAAVARVHHRQEVARMADLVLAALPGVPALEGSASHRQLPRVLLREEVPATPAARASAPASPPGFFGWLKSLVWRRKR